MLKFFRTKKLNSDLSPEDVFLDAHNLPQFNLHQYEGRFERRITEKSALIVIALFLLVTLIFSGKLWSLQIKEGQAFAERSENNRLDIEYIYANRGVIYDRKGNELAWNIPASEDRDFPERAYISKEGLSHVLGYVSYPKKDAYGVYYEKEYKGVLGAEALFNKEISGTQGVRLIETDALSNTLSRNIVTQPQSGQSIILSIDSDLQEQLYKGIQNLAKSVDFKGGAGVIMDIYTGEVLALTSYPEFSSSVMTDRRDSSTIEGYFQDEDTPFLNRVTQGLYTPGSIVKPFMALGALNERLIHSTDKVRSTGRLVIPNPYNPDNPTIFTDWRAHGLVDVVDALAVSSNIYFYVVGGGYNGQQGLGISNINKYVHAFNIGDPTGIQGFEETKGVVPNPEWKKEVFDGEDWRLGDTYLTAIGQYGFQVTPLQMLRAVSGIAREGVLVTPSLKKGGSKHEDPVSVDISTSAYAAVHRGMREAVLRGTAAALRVPYVEVAAKTGTAEVGISKSRVNSWVMGFYPYTSPKYAFVVMMERGPRTNLMGASSVMRGVFDWMHINRPEYFQNQRDISLQGQYSTTSSELLPEIEL